MDIKDIRIHSTYKLAKDFELGGDVPARMGQSYLEIRAGTLVEVRDIFIPPDALGELLLVRYILREPTHGFDTPADPVRLNFYITPDLLEPVE